MRAHLFVWFGFFVFALFTFLSIGSALDNIGARNTGYFIFAALFTFVLGLAFTLVRLGKRSAQKKYERTIRMVVSGYAI